MGSEGSQTQFGGPARWIGEGDPMPFGDTVPKLDTPVAGYTCCENGNFGDGHECEKNRPAWFAAAVEAYDDAAGVGLDPWDPATSFWNGYVKAVSNATGRSVEDITGEVRAHVTGR